MQTEKVNIKSSQSPLMLTYSWEEKVYQEFLSDVATKDSIYTQNDIINKQKTFVVNKYTHSIWSFNNNQQRITIDNNFKFGTAHWHPTIDNQLVTSYGVLAGLPVPAGQKSEKIKILNKPEVRYANEVVLWQINQNQNSIYSLSKIATVTTEKKRAVGAFFSPDGTKLAIVSYDKTRHLERPGDNRPYIDIFDITTPKNPQFEKRFIGAEANLDSVIWSPDSSKIAVFINNQVVKDLYIYDIKNPENNSFSAEDLTV